MTAEILELGMRHVTAELEDGEIVLTVWTTSDPGPMRHFKPHMQFKVDDAHACELLGTLALAIEKKRTGRK